MDVFKFSNYYLAKTSITNIALDKWRFSKSWFDLKKVSIPSIFRKQNLLSQTSEYILNKKRVPAKFAKKKHEMK